MSNKWNYQKYIRSTALYQHSETMYYNISKYSVIIRWVLAGCVG